MTTQLSFIETLINEAHSRPDTKFYLEREEVGDSELFAELLLDQVVFDHADRSWYVWCGHYWSRDRDGEMYRLITNNLVPEYLRAATESTHAGGKEPRRDYMERARALLKRRRIEDVLKLATNMKRLALTGDEWDSSPMLLGVNNGVIDLLTGTKRDGIPTEYLRVHAPVNYMGLDYPAPAWKNFLSEVFNGEIEMVNFLQRLLGYCLTGKTIEHRLPILYGEGRNGKSTLMRALAYVFGDDLSHTTQADALMDLKRDGAGPQPFVHALRGKRLVWATESKEGQRVNSGLIKQLTGGDLITTRTLFKDVTTFKPTHKVMLLTNHKPHISAEDQAMWDRVLLIPFEVRFVNNPMGAKERQRNPRLLEFLETEKAGILAWLVQGCLAWQEQGLNPPAMVITATEGYRQEEDTLGEFIADCLVTGEGKRATTKDIYDRYVRYSQNRGIDPMSLKALSQRLRRRFGEPVHKMEGTTFEGVGVRYDG